MKRILFPTAAILAIAVAIFWQQSREISAVRAEIRGLRSEVGADPAATDRETERRARSTREGRPQVSSEEVVARIVEEQALRAAGGKETPDEARSRLTLWLRVASMSPSELSELLMAIRGMSHLPDDIRSSAASRVLGILVQDHPLAALELILRVPELKTAHPSSLRSSLSWLAKSDPMMALDWLQQHGRDWSGPEQAAATHAILEGAAQRHPVTALEMIRDQQPMDQGTLLMLALQALETPADREAATEVAREIIAAADDANVRTGLERMALGTLFRNAASDGLEQAAAWIDQAGITPPELVAATAGELVGAVPLEEIPAWLEWLGSHLPEEDRISLVAGTIENWTKDDFPAALDWLASAPDDAARHQAVGMFVWTTTTFHPEAVVRIPVGKLPAKDLHWLWKELKADDAAVAQAFAEKHGLR